MNAQRVTNVLQILTLVAVVALGLALVLDLPAAQFSQQSLGGGVTNLDDLTLADDLIVGDDSTLTDDVDIGGSVNFGSNDLYPLGYASDGYQVVCNSSTITGTGAIAHGLATPVVVLAAIADDVDGDHARVSSTNVSATVTIKLWNTALTPAAATTPAVVDWCVVGVP